MFWCGGIFSFWTCHRVASPWEYCQWCCGRTSALSSLSSQSGRTATEATASRTWPVKNKENARLWCGIKTRCQHDAPSVFGFVFISSDVKGIVNGVGYWPTLHSDWGEGNGCAGPVLPGTGPADSLLGLGPSDRVSLCQRVNRRPQHETYINIDVCDSLPTQPKQSVSHLAWTGRSPSDRQTL